MILEVPQLDLLSVFKRPSQRRDGLPGAASLPSISWTYSKVWGKMRSRSFSSISYKVEVPSFRSTPPRFFSLVSWSSYFAAKWTCRTLVWKYGTPKFVIICPIQTAWFWILTPLLDKPWQTHIFSGYLQYKVCFDQHLGSHFTHPLGTIFWHCNERWWKQRFQASNGKQMPPRHACLKESDTYQYL